MELGDIQRLLPGDRVIYLGWDSDHILRVGDTLIKAKGVTLNDNELVDFIDFEGPGVPGYSGGPVLNDEKEVVGMIVQGWDLTTIKVPTTVRVLRAFSVDLLRILEQRLRSTSKTKESNVGESQRLMKLLEDSGSTEP